MSNQDTNKFTSYQGYIRSKQYCKMNDFTKPMEFNDIYQIEIELLNVCNLSCPLCARANPEVINFLSSHKAIHLDFEVLTTTLLKFPSLKKVHLVGGICEPTLYKEFIPLLEWLKEHNFVIMISTNASTLNEEKWKQIGNILQEEDEIRFAIDGSTQQSYEVYRKGGNLQKIISNFLAFSHSKAFKVLQMIKFKHNKEQYEEEIKTISKFCNNKFDYIYRLTTGSAKPEIGLEYPDQKKSKIDVYKKIFQQASNKIRQTLAKDIYCYSKVGFIYINHLGQFITCCDRYEEFLLDPKPKPTIYNFDKDELMDYLNNIYEDIPNTETCIKYCHKMVQLLQEPDDKIYRN